MLENSNILVTGGSGSFGHTFIPMTLERFNPKKVVIFSRDEMKQWEMSKKFGNDPRVRFFIGDVRDKDRLIKAMRNVDFVIQTPTSVASVKGTDFWLLSDDNGDQVIGMEGQVSLVNTETGQEVNVTSGMTGVSTPDGQVGITETDVATIPEDPDDSSVENPSQLKIYLEGPNGEQKVFIIDYQ